MAKLQLRETRSRVSLLAVGDISLHGSITEQFLRSGAKSILGDTLEIFQRADVRVGNLESVLTEKGEAIFGGRAIMRAEPSTVEVLKTAGFDVVTVANNHCLDLRMPGFLRSLEVLRDSGIQVCGVSNAPEGSHGATVLEARGLRIGFLGFCDNFRIDAVETSVPASLSDGVVIQAIHELCQEVDIVVLQLHWGFEFEFYPPKSYRDRARTYADAGADLILCHHAHLPMGIEIWGKSLIAHGLGNFIFGNSPYLRAGHRWHNRSFMLRVGLDHEGVTDASVLPCEINSGSVTLSQRLRCRQMLGALYKLSAGLQNDAKLTRIERHRTALEAISLCNTILAGDRETAIYIALNLCSPFRKDVIRKMKNDYGNHGRVIANFMELVAETKGELDYLEAAKRMELTESIAKITADEDIRDMMPGRIP